MPYHISDRALSAFNAYIEQSGIPIPEFLGAATILASALQSLCSYYDAERNNSPIPHLGRKRPFSLPFPLYLVEESPSIDGKMVQLDKAYLTMDRSICILALKMVECLRYPNIKLLVSSIRESCDTSIPPQNPLGSAQDEWLTCQKDP